MLLGSLVLGLSSGNCSTTDLTKKDNIQPKLENKNDVRPILEYRNYVEPVSEKIFCYHTEQPPQFPGGENALMKFIKENVNYSNVISSDGKKPVGRVTLKFAVNEDGSVSEIVVIKGLDPACDKEAVRVVKLMPKFIPGKQSGEVCKTWFILPVYFWGYDKCPPPSPILPSKSPMPAT